MRTNVRCGYGFHAGGYDNGDNDDGEENSLWKIKRSDAKLVFLWHSSLLSRRRRPDRPDTVPGTVDCCRSKFEEDRSCF